jgi:cytochrome c2
MTKQRVATLAAMAVFGALAVPMAFSAAALAQDAENGEAVFRQCRACHQVGDGAKNLVGPQLNGAVGRKASSVEGYSYSQASKDAAAKGLVWTEDVLMKYLENPTTFMPGTKMAFAGLKDEDARKDVIEYLKKAGK